MSHIFTPKTTIQINLHKTLHIFKSSNRNQKQNRSLFQGSQELVDDGSIHIRINLQLTRVGAGRSVQEKIVEKPPLRSQHRGVHRRRRSLRIVQAPDVVGEETLEELDGFGSAEPDYGSGF